VANRCDTARGKEMPRQHEDSEFREDGTIASPVKHGEAGEKFDAMPIAWLGLFFLIFRW
jgi:hypothetical protein